MRRLEEDPKARLTKLYGVNRIRRILKLYHSHTCSFKRPFLRRLLAQGNCLSVTFWFGERLLALVDGRAAFVVDRERLNIRIYRISAAQSFKKLEKLSENFC